MKPGSVLCAVAALPVLCACGGKTGDAASTFAPDAAHPLDGAPPRDAMRDAPADVRADAPEFPPCPIDTPPNSSVAGTTPSGPFNGRFAWLGKTEGECSSSIFVVFSEVADMTPRRAFASPSPPTLLFNRGQTMDGVSLGIAAHDFLFEDGDSSELRTRGTVELTHADYPHSDAGPGTRAEGKLELTADGFAISGSFVAPYCGWLDVYCP